MKVILYFSLCILLGLLTPAPVRADDSSPMTPFAFTSGIASYDAAYVKARGVIQADTQGDSFIAGQNWSQVWTRDTSYSVDLACALISPEVSKDTLLAQKQQVDGIGECWLQDVCGHFQGWPHLTDAIVGANGAWSLYKVTGDRTLLQPAFDRTARSLQRAEQDAYKPALGLFGGCSTFMESDSAYPGKYQNNGPAIANTCCLSTNLLYYQAYRVNASIAQLLGLDPAPFLTRANLLKDAINRCFWMPGKGYYGYFVDQNGTLDEHMEGTGEAFAILFGVASQAQAKSILANTPTTPLGFPCQWPQYADWMNYNTGDAMYYHNGMIWPFVEGYWAWAAAREGDVNVFGSELDKLTALSEKADTFQEFYRPEDGKPDGSPRQLWSASGYLSMVYHGLFGMDFEPGGIAFSPVVPSKFQSLTLSDVAYRSSTLNITVDGNGNVVKSFSIDGKKSRYPFFNAANVGTHSIVMVMGS